MFRRIFKRPGFVNVDRLNNTRGRRASPLTTQIFGYDVIGASDKYFRNLMQGSWFTCPEAGVAESITMYNDYNYPYAGLNKCALYRRSDLALIKSTEERVGLPKGWNTFNFTDPKPSLSNMDYWLLFWQDGSNPELRYDAAEEGKGHEVYYPYADWPNLIGIAPQPRIYSIYCTYTTEVTPPTYDLTLLSDRPAYYTIEPIQLSGVLLFNGAPVPDALITLYRDGTPIFEVPTSGDGSYYFEDNVGIEGTVNYYTEHIYGGLIFRSNHIILGRT